MIKYNVSIIQLVSGYRKWYWMPGTYKGEDTKFSSCKNIYDTTCQCSCPYLYRVCDPPERPWET